MASCIKNIDEVKIPDTYGLEQHEWVSELDSYALVLRHKLSGARILMFSNEDENKVFSVNFRTPPKDATGVPHIIEHTVLCGSKKFPAKDPFVELVKGSLNTYLNATTYPDKTLYPVASCNDKDFQNLMHVYMDAVFHPNIYIHEEIFKQEGWHYELNCPEDPVIYNGVVYNEMKGAYSSEEGVLERYMMNGLFPDNTYGQESGGDPACIPNLTYEEYLNFHRTYYHPANSYIYLYGNMDIEERLQWMDQEYLSQFPAITVDSTIPLQKPFDQMHCLDKVYAVSQNETEQDKTFYSYATAMDITLDQEVCRAFELLAYVLVEMPGAPLKQALLDAGMGNDVDVDFCDILRQSYFCVTTKNAEVGKKQEFLKVIRDTLQELVSQGIDRKVMEAAINGTEFREREADFGAFPKGLYYCLKSMKTWLYDDNQPYAGLCYDHCYTFLREQLSTDYYEQLIQKYLLDNPHALLLEMNPKQGLQAEKEQAEKDRLAAYKASLSPEQIQQLIEDTRALKAYQEEPSPKEVLEMIPMLSRADIERKVQPYYNTELVLDGIKTVHHNIHTNDIIYLEMYFDVDDMEEYMPQMGFLATLLGYMDTEKHSYTEFDTETNFYTGGISSDVELYGTYSKKDDIHISFETRTKVLRSQMQAAMDLIAEMFFSTKFEDEKHLKEVVSETRSRLKVRLMSSGHLAAASRAESFYTRKGWLNNASAGLGYYDYLSDLEEHFQEKKQELMDGCRAILDHILSADKLLLSCTCDEAGRDALGEALKGFLNKMEDWKAANTVTSLDVLQKYPVQLGSRQEGVMTPAEIQYVAVSGDYSNVAPAKFGVMQVVRHLLNYDFLWNEVRVKGGAYGVACRFNRTMDGFFTSYRDPKLKETLEVYKKAGQYLRHYEAEEREITKTIIGTISGLDIPMTPAMKGRRSFMGWRTQLSLEVAQQDRDAILDCTCEDIRSAAPAIEAIAQSPNICVIGNEQHLEKEKELFTELKTLS